MSLTEGVAAVLARRVVDLLDPGIDIRIEPEPRDDPYRFGTARRWAVWPLVDGDRSFGVYLDDSMSEQEALIELLEVTNEHVAGTARFWGLAFPVCLDHAHPAAIDADGADVVWRCPASGAEVGRMSL